MGPNFIVACWILSIEPRGRAASLTWVKRLRLDRDAIPGDQNGDVASRRGVLTLF